MGKSRLFNVPIGTMLALGVARAASAEVPPGVREGWRTTPGDKFKKDVTAGDVFLRILVHNQEHMGIAHVRMNGIAPPWSPAREQQRAR